MSVSSHLQGLYPQNKNLGYILTEKQLKNSNPPVDVSSTEIQEEITKLQNNALPHNMTLIPFEISEDSNGNMRNCKGEKEEKIHHIQKTWRLQLKNFMRNMQKK